MGKRQMPENREPVSKPPDKEMFEEIKCLNPRKSNQSGCIKGKEGKIIFEAEKIIERWKEYIEDLFADQRPENPIKTSQKVHSTTNEEGQSHGH